KVYDILFFEWWEVGALIILVLTTSATYIRRRIFIFRWVLPAIGWTGWITIAGFLLPEYHRTGDIFTIGVVALLLLALACLALIAVIWDFLRNFRSTLRPVFKIGLVIAVLYLSPLILWTQGIIPRYSTALGVALFLTTTSIIMGIKYLRPILPTVEL